MKRPTLRALAGVAAASALMWAAPIPAFADDPKDPLTITIERTDNLGDTVREGDRLTYTISYTNNTDETITAYPRTSNMSDVAVGAAKNCRWAKLKPQATEKCTFGYHVTGVDDVASGFTPTVTFDATRDREGTDIIKTGITAQAPTVKVEPVELADGVKRNLATAGLAGFACHRIPALTTANNGWIIAAWDGRPGGCADAPQANSIIGRISKDGGKTWSEPMTIAAGKQGKDKYGYSDPSFVTDRETGEIFAFFVKSFDRGIAASEKGTDPQDRNVIHAAVTSSTDNGLTWSTPRVITADITGDPTKEYGRFATSGEGIQLRYGEHAGRLIQQFAVNYVKGLEMRAVSVYSDDHGKTWKAGTPFGAVIDGREPSRMDENKVVELSDGTLMVNSRTQGSGSPKARWVAYSTDGGQTYSEVKADHTLVDPRNNASIIRAYPNAPEGSRCAKILLFSNAATTNSRTTGTIRVSYDDGKTWTPGKIFESGAMQYSTMTALPQSGHYGLLYESAGPTITYMPFSMKWLGEDRQCDLVDAGTQTDPIDTNDEGTQTDPIDTNDEGTQTDPIDTNDEGTQTDPADTNDEGTQTDPTDTNDEGTHTNPTDTNDEGTHTNPARPGGDVAEQEQPAQPVIDRGDVVTPGSGADSPAAPKPTTQPSPAPSTGEGTPAPAAQHEIAEKDRGNAPVAGSATTTKSTDSLARTGASTALIALLASTLLAGGGLVVRSRPKG